MEEIFPFFFFQSFRCAWAKENYFERGKKDRDKESCSFIFELSVCLEVAWKKKKESFLEPKEQKNGKDFLSDF